MRVRGWRKVFHANENQKNAGVAILILHKIDFKAVRWGEDLQHGGGVRGGDHLPPQKYIKNTSTCGTTTEHLLNAGRRPQTSQKVRNSPHT